MNRNQNVKETMDYIADYGGWTLGVAMYIYLGFRTLDFLTWSFREEDVFFAYLGLFSTTVGAIIFAVIWVRSRYFDARAGVWRVDEARKSVALVMMFICAGGEVLLAVADMSLVTTAKGAVPTMTVGQLKTYMWLTACLAALVGGAIAKIHLTPRHPKTDPIIDMSELDVDNNGVLDYREEKPGALTVNQLDVLLGEIRVLSSRIEEQDRKISAGSAVILSNDRNDGEENFQNGGKV
jgi:hypothetical protein